MNSSPITKTRVLLVLAAVVCFWAIGYFFTHGLVTIESFDQDEVTVYVRKDGFEDQFKLNGSSKRLVLGTGSYEVEVTKNDNQSIYSLGVRGFGVKHLNVKTVDAVNSEFLGVHSLNCARSVSGNPVYYSCSPSGSAIIDNGSVASNENELETTTLPDSRVLKPYGNSFIEASKANNLLAVSSRENAKAGKPLFKIRGFGGDISDNNFSTYGGLAFFDTKNSVLYISSNPSSGNYSSLDIDTGEFKSDSVSQVQVYKTSSFTYLVSSTSSEELANNMPEKGAKESLRVLVVNNLENKLIKNIQVDPGLEINSMFSGNDVLMLIAKEGSLYSLGPGGKLSTVKGVSESIQQGCSDSNGFYYLADGGHSIYHYSTNDEGSFRLYFNQYNSVNSISCVGGNLYFVLNNSNSEDLNLNYHYKLGNKPQKGARLDSVLPTYYTVSLDTFKFNESPSGIAVNLVYDSDNNGVTASKNTIVAALVKTLREKGVETKNLNIRFGF